MALQSVVVSVLSEAELALARPAFTTRNVPASVMHTLISGRVRPRSGDLVMARVSRLGNHRRIELPDGRKAGLNVGDNIIVCYADRYAPDQYEAVVPTSLARTNLVASGGCAADAVSKSMDVRNPTVIAPLGLIGDEHGRPLNLRDFALPREQSGLLHPRTVAVVGTSMNSGKTTTISSLVYGLAQAGARPGATKVTGTGSGGDFWVMIDAGVHTMLDFTDAGVASTYKQPMNVIERIMTQLTSHLTMSGTGVNLIEVADGIYQQETSKLIRTATFAELVDGVIFAAGDAGGAYAGVQVLQGLGHNVLGISGKLTRSPLAVREAAAITGLPVLTRSELMDPKTALELLGIDESVLQDPLPVREAAWPEDLVAAPLLLNLDAERRERAERQRPREPVAVAKRSLPPPAAAARIRRRFHLRLGGMP
ncbi:hypothetical protein GCM10009715_43420 [Paeniglutamicibacter psychrophenolicus]|uniref:DUF1611 domain-containing protein n=1 Tax=Paeniglutamicibacter psychrophenolicus TaxID=257454 RepID=A0ABS4WIW8_9MICC|nr:DUF1611 domain-containing protein [Paeniglutamicibacter psychrophenolicus]MBP2376154.1 hypothetical protein [Paeniglutamicibacter psychrophenolicus]